MILHNNNNNNNNNNNKLSKLINNKDVINRIYIYKDN